MNKIVITEEMLYAYSQSSTQITPQQRRAIMLYLAERPEELERVMQMTAAALEVGMESAPALDDRYERGMDDCDKREKYRLTKGLNRLYKELKSEAPETKIVNFADIAAAKRVAKSVFTPFRGAASFLADNSGKVSTAANRRKSTVVARNIPTFRMEDEITVAASVVRRPASASAKSEKGLKDKLASFLKKK